MKFLYFLTAAASLAKSEFPIAIPIQSDGVSGSPTVNVWASRPHKLQIATWSSTGSGGGPFGGVPGEMRVGDVIISLQTGMESRWFEYTSYSHEIGDGLDDSYQIGIGPQSSLTNQANSTAIIRPTPGQRGGLILGISLERFVGDYCESGTGIHIPVAIIQPVNTFDIAHITAHAQIQLDGSPASPTMTVYMSAVEAVMGVPDHLMEPLARIVGLPERIDGERIFISDCETARSNLPHIAINFRSDVDISVGEIVLSPSDYTRESTDEDDVCELLIRRTPRYDSPNSLWINLLMVPYLNIRSTNDQISICDSL